MFILLNGSFGIGKTTVAELLRDDLPDAVIFDPEQLGYILRRLPAWLLGLRRQPDDYQDLAIWRTLIAQGARRQHGRAGVVIVPMAFTNLQYWNEFALALQARSTVHQLCLVAPSTVTRARLKERAQRQGREITEFESRRSEECAVAHTNPAFGVPVDATATPPEIMAAIKRLTSA